MVPLADVPRPRAAARRRPGGHRRRAAAARRDTRSDGGRAPQELQARPGARRASVRRPGEAVPEPDGNRGTKVGEFESDADEFEWRVLFVAGMWFQDLFNYDFRRTEMCIIPYGTQVGEISFCAYNTGVGWRNVIEKIRGQRERRRVVPQARAPRGLREESGSPAAGDAGHGGAPRIGVGAREARPIEEARASPHRGGMNRAARTAIAGFSPALVVLACSSSTSTPMSPNDGGTGADATVSTEGGSGTDGASSAPLDGASTDATSVSSDGGPACGQFAGDTANLTCSANGNSLGECLADGGLNLQQCPNGCLREPAGQDSICMGTTNTWSCTGEWGTTPASNGNYYLTEFGCWVDDAGVHTDPDDNCIPACLAQAQAAGLCASTDTGPQCEERVTWYTADAGRFGMPPAPPRYQPEHRRDGHRGRARFRASVLRRGHGAVPGPRRERRRR